MSQLALDAEQTEGQASTDTLGGEAAETEEGQEGRRRGGRGRNRRGERRDDTGQTETAEGTETAAGEVAPVSAALSTAEANVLTDVLGIPAQSAPVADTPAAAPAQPVVEAAPVAEPIAAPAPAPFVLPMDDLSAIAQSAGLQWVNSDAEKIRQVQEAIANEPKPVHVPRERKPLVVLDEGPLVLVETRKDLNQITLPFEQQAH